MRSTRPCRNADASRRRTRLGELDARERQLSPREAEVRRIADSAAQLVPDGTSLIADLTRAKDLPGKKAEMKDAMAQLNQMNRDTFEQRENELRELGGELTDWEKELRKRLQNQTHLRVEEAIKIRDAAASEESAQQETFRVVAGEFDISQYLMRADEVRGELAQFPAHDVKAGKCAALEREAEIDTKTYWEQLKAERQKLALNPRWGRKFEDLVVENPSNSDYDQRLELIEHGRIEEYTKKSEDERRRWEGLFRTQVLQKMEQGLKKVRDDVFLLNLHLRQPITTEMHRAGSPESCAVCEMNPEFFALLADATFRLKARMILVSRYFAPEERIALFETLGLQTGGRDETTTARLLEEAEEVASRKGRSARLRCGQEDRGPQTSSAGGYPTA